MRRIEIGRFRRGLPHKDIVDGRIVNHVVANGVTKKGNGDGSETGTQLDFTTSHVPPDRGTGTGIQPYVLLSYGTQLFESRIRSRRNQSNGNTPSAIRSMRSSTTSGSFIARAWTVARPVGVRPMR